MIVIWRRLFVLITIGLTTFLLPGTPHFNVVWAQETTAIVDVTPSPTDTPAPTDPPTSTPSPSPSPTATLTAAPTDTPSPTPGLPSPTVEDQTSTPVSEPMPSATVESQTTPSPPEASPERVDPKETEPAPNATSSPTPTATATTEPKVIIRMESADVDFGQVSASGAIDPSVRGVKSIARDNGAWYVKERAIRISVNSTGPWSGGCWSSVQGTDGSGSEGGLAWRLSGTTNWTPFASTSPKGDSCFDHGKPGITTFEYDLRLWVSNEDQPRSFKADISFEVKPAGDSVN